MYTRKAQFSAPRRGLAAAAMLAFALPLAALAQPNQPYRPSRDREQGQQRDRDQQDRRDEGRQLFRPGQQRTQDQPGTSWSIVLFAFRGDEQQQDATRALARVQSEWALQDAYLEKRGPATVIAFGRYSEPGDQRAQADLKRIRSLEVEVGGEKQQPFEFAFLAPPGGTPGTIPEFDLRNAQRLHGRDALYTLQIGMYGRSDGTPSSGSEMVEFRRHAEEAVVQLRREGEQAFYYHGPTGSMVTVGLFGTNDFDPQDRIESPRLRTLRQRYPQNLLNGAGIRRTVRVTDQQGRLVKTERLDPSVLVVVPRDQTRR